MKILRQGTLAAALVAGTLAGGAALAAESDGTAWSDIRGSLFGDTAMKDDGLIAIEAPYRAEDAAIVPVTIRTDVPQGDPRHVAKITLVIDENPAPVAATFTLGEGANVTAIATRVRINAYTPVHVVAELSDGSLHVAETYVKASGGCAAPMAKDQDVADANIGKMKMRWFGRPLTDIDATPDPIHATAQLMIRHPNNSGLQMDQVTRFYIPAHFVSNVTIRQGNALVLTMEGGISISEDPNFRFAFVSNGEPLVVEATDTEGNDFGQTFPVPGS
ncbi:quinoprotein dehydrogenase-associated SoxYZ-like carrier [Acuticoccus sediminis]|nr:quinoprotein dehydrogenase-associated SoxYZ-like carrier [Acuticoccus sediminis]